MRNTNTPLFSFGVIADAQYCECEPAIGRYYRRSISKLSEALQTLDQQDLAFILDMGDLIDRDYGSFDEVLDIYNRSKFQVYRVLGNHDFSVTEAKKDLVASRLGLNESAYYDFVYLGWRIVMLNGNEVSTYAHTESNAATQEAEQKLIALEKAGRPNAKPWNGGISQVQLTWLESRLKLAAQQGQKVIVCNHFPAYPDDPHNLWNDTEVVSLLLEYSVVVAYFNGHNHAGNYKQNEHIHFLTYQGMVETATENAFARVEVYKKRLKVVGFGRQESRDLDFS